MSLNDANQTLQITSPIRDAINNAFRDIYEIMPALRPILWRDLNYIWDDSKEPELSPELWVSMDDDMDIDDTNETERLPILPLIPYTLPRALDLDQDDEKENVIDFNAMD